MSETILAAGLQGSTSGIVYSRESGMTFYRNAGTWANDPSGLVIGTQEDPRWAAHSYGLLTEFCDSDLILGNAFGIGVYKDSDAALADIVSVVQAAPLELQDFINNYLSLPSELTAQLIADNLLVDLDTIIRETPTVQGASIEVTREEDETDEDFLARAITLITAAEYSEEGSVTSSHIFTAETDFANPIESTDILWVRKTKYTNPGAVPIQLKDANSHALIHTLAPNSIYEIIPDAVGETLVETFENSVSITDVCTELVRGLFHGVEGHHLAESFFIDDDDRFTYQVVADWTEGKPLQITSLQLLPDGNGTRLVQPDGTITIFDRTPLNLNFEPGDLDYEAGLAAKQLVMFAVAQEVAAPMAAEAGGIGLRWGMRFLENHFVMLSNLGEAIESIPLVRRILAGGSAVDESELLGVVNQLLARALEDTLGFAKSFKMTNMWQQIRAEISGPGNYMGREAMAMIKELAKEGAYTQEQMLVYELRLRYSQYFDLAARGFDPVTGSEIDAARVISESDLISNPSFRFKMEKLFQEREGITLNPP